MALLETKPDKEEVVDLDEPAGVLSDFVVDVAVDVVDVEEVEEFFERLA